MLTPVDEYNNILFKREDLYKLKMIQSDLIVKRESVESYLKFLTNLKLEFPENKSELDLQSIDNEILFNPFNNVNREISQNEIVGLIKGINIVAKKLKISVDTGKGYRALVNIADYGGQEVPHLHFHLFGGEKIGKMVQ